MASKVAAVAAASIGCFVLFGYLTRWSTAVRLLPSLPPMYPSTALSFVVLGTACLLTAQTGRFSRFASVLFALVAAFGLATIVLHVGSAGSTWLDSLWPDRPFVQATTPVPGRPVVETCVALICIGLAGILISLRRSAALAQGLALGTVSVGTAAILGYLIGVDRSALGTSFVAVGMALHTAVALVLSGLAVLLSRPTIGLFGRLTSTGPSAALGRRLVLVVVAAPICLTALSAALSRWLPDAGLALSVAAVLQIVALGLLVTLPISAAERVEFAAAQELQQARTLTEEMGERDAVMEALGRELSHPPQSFDGWIVGFRQSVAVAELPGDSCQLLQSPHGQWLLAVIDVAGHGTEAALQALRLRTEVAALWTHEQTLATIAIHLDKTVQEMDTIATGVLITLDPASGDCEYINAGHPAPLQFVNNATSRWPPTQRLFGLGPTVPVSAVAHLEIQSLLVVYTDGVSEARSRGRAELGENNVSRLVMEFAHAGAQALADACVDAALEFSGARLRDDALAIVLVRA